MELTTIRELFKDRESYLGKKVTIGGWVRSLRDSKTFGFIVVNDGSYFEPLQIVYHDEMENFAEVSKLNVGAAIIVKGTLVATPQAKQPFEIQADEVQIEGASASDYPLQKKRHTFEYLRTISHLRPRTNTFQAVFRVRSLAAYAIHKFFQERGFVYVHTPLITGSDCEGAGEMFQVTTLPLKDMPFAFASPEWSNEKGLDASLAFRLFGISSYHCVEPPAQGSDHVMNFLKHDTKDTLGSTMTVIVDPKELARKIVTDIQAKRKQLNW